MSEKTLQQRLDELVEVTESAATYKERTRILEAVLGLEIPCIPLATIRRLLEAPNND